MYTGKDDVPDEGTTMGHEFVGTITQTGTDVKTLALGDRVVAPFTTCCGKCFFCRHALPARCEEGQLFGWRRNGVGLHGAQAEFVRVPLADTTLVKVHCMHNFLCSFSGRNKIEEDYLHPISHDEGEGHD